MRTTHRISKYGFLSDLLVGLLLGLVLTSAATYLGLLGWWSFPIFLGISTGAPELWRYLAYPRELSARWALEHNLRVCLYCGYPLVGLRPNGTCPECGNTYDVADSVAQWHDRLKGNPVFFPPRIFRLWWNHVATPESDQLIHRSRDPGESDD